MSIFESLPTSFVLQSRHNQFSARGGSATVPEDRAASVWTGLACPVACRLLFAASVTVPLGSATVGGRVFETRFCAARVRRSKPLLVCFHQCCRNSAVASAKVKKASGSLDQLSLLHPLVHVHVKYIHFGYPRPHLPPSPTSFDKRRTHKRILVARPKRRSRTPFRRNKVNKQHGWKHHRPFRDARGSGTKMATVIILD